MKKSIENILEELGFVRDKSIKEYIGPIDLSKQNIEYIIEFGKPVIAIINQRERKKEGNNVNTN